MDDLYSLLCVAYYFVIGTLPWIDYIERLHETGAHPGKNFYKKDTYRKLRLKKRKVFDAKLIETG